MFSAISRSKFLFVKMSSWNDMLGFLIKWCVGKIVYNANPPAGYAENAKYNWLFSAPLASSIFLNIQVYCDRRTRNFAKLTGFYRKYFVVFIFDFLRVVFVLFNLACNDI